MDIKPNTITIDQLTQLAIDGQLSKETLAQLLAPEQRRAYTDACGAIEKTFTHACSTSGDSCLESGCSIDHEHGEVCLQPLLRAGADYQKKCGETWARFFSNPKNRVDAWKH